MLNDAREATSSASRASFSRKDQLCPLEAPRHRGLATPRRIGRGRGGRVDRVSSGTSERETVIEASPAPGGTLAVEDRHLAFVVALAGGRTWRYGLLDRRHVVGGKVEVNGGNRLG
jgi:hypothetical protein